MAIIMNSRNPSVANACTYVYTLIHTHTHTQTHTHVHSTHVSCRPKQLFTNLEHNIDYMLNNIDVIVKYMYVRPTKKLVLYMYNARTYYFTVSIGLCNCVHKASLTAIESTAKFYVSLLTEAYYARDLDRRANCIRHT